MTLTFDPERQVKTRSCDCCGGTHHDVTGFIYRAGDAYAVYYAACYPHNRETWIDVILGTWGDGDHDDRVTFGCRVGPVAEQEDPGCSLVTAAIAYSDSALFGTKLDRNQALNHPWLEQFWQVVDFILTEDPTVHGHVYDCHSTSDRTDAPGE